MRLFFGRETGNLLRLVWFFRRLRLAKTPPGSTSPISAEVNDTAYPFRWTGIRTPLGYQIVRVDSVQHIAPWKTRGSPGLRIRRGRRIRAATLNDIQNVVQGAVQSEPGAAAPSAVEGQRPDKNPSRDRKTTGRVKCNASTGEWDITG